MHARDRRAAGRVLAHEVRDDRVRELALEIDDVVGDADAAATRRASWRSSIVQQLPKRARSPALVMVVELHRQADDLVALLGEQRRGHRRIDAARHGNDDPR